MSDSTKNIRIGAQLDTSDFDNKINQLRSKLNSLQSNANSSKIKDMFGENSPQGQVMARAMRADEINRAKENVKQFQENLLNIRKLKDEQDKFNTSLERKNELIQEANKLAQDNLKLTKATNDMGFRMPGQQKERQQNQEDKAKLEQASDKFGSSIVEKIIKMAGVSTIGSIISNVGGVFNQIAGQDAMTASLKANVGQGVGANLIQNALRGRGFEDAVFGSLEKYQKLPEMLGLTSKGNVLGAMGNVVKTLGFGLFDQGNRDQLMSPFFQDSSQRANLKDMSDALQNIRTEQEADKKKQPLKYEAQQLIQQLAPGLAQFQRVTGLSSDSTLDYIERGGKAGFTPNEIIGQSQAAMNRGGTKMGTSGITAMLLQRNFGLMNSGSLLGEAGRFGGTSKESEEKLFKVMSEATKIGLDSSATAKELQAFSTATFQIASSTGLKDADKVASMISSGLGGGPVTMAGIEGAASAYQDLNEKMRGGGITSYIAKQSMMKGFKKNDVSAMATLSARTPDQLSEDTPANRDLARRFGISFEEFRDLAQGSYKDLANTEMFGSSGTEEEKKAKFAQMMGISGDTQEKIDAEYNMAMGKKAPLAGKSKEDLKALSEQGLKGMLERISANPALMVGAILGESEKYMTEFKAASVDMNKQLQKSIELTLLYAEAMKELEKSGEAAMSTRSRIKTLADKIAEQSGREMPKIQNLNPRVIGPGMKN